MIEHFPALDARSSGIQGQALLPGEHNISATWTFFTFHIRAVFFNGGCLVFILKTDRAKHDLSLRDDQRRRKQFLLCVSMTPKTP